MPKKKYQVIKATTRNIPGVYVGGRKKQFKKNGTFETDDPGEANEINKVLGMKGTGEVVVVANKEVENGHTYTFGASRKFAEAWEAFEKRRKRKHENEKEKHGGIHDVKKTNGRRYGKRHAKNDGAHEAGHESQDAKNDER